MKFCFVFVCQRGELEIKAQLLASSLNRFLRCDHELVAALPQPESAWGVPSPATLSFLGGLGVRLAPIVNPIGPEYPIGNKLACLSIDTDAEKIVFLDSDMLCLREFPGDDRFGKFEANLKPADLASFGADFHGWVQAYRACDSPLDDTRVRATVSGQEMPPYFNAGFVAVNADRGLGAAWIACARAIDADPLVPDKRPWLDQIALPIALARLGLTVDCLDERFNYPAHLKPIDPRNPPLFVHYHSPDVLRAEPLANGVVAELAGEHRELRDAMEASPAWRALLQPYALSATPGPSGITDPDPHAGSRSPTPREVDAPPDLVITGIPRSGTSYLCKLIHGVEDCVVINEPGGIFGPLAQQPVPWGVSLLYRDLRREIRDGRAIANKLHHGEFIEDTAQFDTVEQYHPRVSRPDFLLGTKNTLAYLARLSRIRLAMPNARIVACVRHPLDTIASWKTTFQHLANADLESQVIGHSGDPFLTGHQRDRLREIAAAATLAQKRALAWRYLAEILLDHRAAIELIRYEDMVAEPATVLGRIFDSTSGMFTPRIPASVAASSPRRKREALDPEDYDAIKGICGVVAAELGYLDE